MQEIGKGVGQARHFQVWTTGQVNERSNHSGHRVSHAILRSEIAHAASKRQAIGAKTPWDVTMTITLDKPDYTTIKARQQAIWSSGDYAVIGTTLAHSPVSHGQADLSSWALSSKWQHALSLALAHRRSAAITVDQLLADDPKSVFGHCLRAVLIVRADDTSGQEKLNASIAFIMRACPDPDHWAHRHAVAARAWLLGSSGGAAELYGAIVIDFPRDILALMAAHALDFRLGRRLLLRDRIAQVLPEWGPGMPGYSSVLAMYAFGLEENGEYGPAERIARQALAADPGHPGAIHVIAHVMEMQGRVSEGLAFLAETEPAWSHTGFSIHLAWHQALLYLEDDDSKSALTVYDTQMANGTVSDIPALADASALLWRLGLRNTPLGNRWEILANRWQMQPLTAMRPFYLVHAMMAFAAARRAAAETVLLKLLPATRKSDASEETLAFMACNALLACSGSNYEACLEWLARLRPIAHRCGGSLAQCDVLHLTYTEAAFRGHKTPLARALVAERLAKKPASRLNRMLQQRLTMNMPG